MSKNEDNLILFPDLLSEDDLRSSLTSKYSKIPNLRRMTREDLLRVYTTMLLPLPQRHYPENRRGKRLSARQGKSRKISSSSDPRHEVNTNRQTPEDRLKPPPANSVDGSSAKKIRLSASTESGRVSSSSTFPKRPSKDDSNSLPQTDSNDGSPRSKKTKITWP